ncbi:MAG TPA: hypothetical protein VG895_00875 [Patescibacteria group bacterium]|nr:hypothetical protein [Patescibacteria group bacterium]
MKKILILVNKITSRHNQITDYLNKNSNNKFILKKLSEISISIIDSKIECFVGDLNLLEFDLVYFRQTRNYIPLAGSIATFCLKNNIPFIDKTFEKVGASKDKLNNLLLIAYGNIPVPNTFYFSREEIINSKDEIMKSFAFPIYAKNLWSQKRNGLFIINEIADFEKLLKKDESNGFLFQEKVEIDKEYRIVVMGNEVVGIHEESTRKIIENKISVNDEESSAGWIDKNNISKELINYSIQGTKSVDLNISGVDICIDKKGKVYVFEINRGPGLTLDPSISPELPELEKYLNSLIK